MGASVFQGAHDSFFSQGFAHTVLDGEMVAETLLERASVHTRSATVRTISAPLREELLSIIFRRCNSCNPTEHSFLACSPYTDSVSASATLALTIRYRVDIAHMKLSSY